MDESIETGKGSPSLLCKRKFHANDPLIVAAQPKKNKLERTQKSSKKKEEKTVKSNVEPDETAKEGRITNARSYQMKILAKALQENTIAYLETGCGKTLIAILLIKEMASAMREKNQKFRAVFMAPTVCLVLQQTSVLRINLDLQVECYYGAKGVDKWSASMWKEEMNSNEVLVMTPMVLLDAVRHGFLSLGSFHLLIFDECHRAQKRHPYAKIMREYYHNSKTMLVKPRIFGTTASPVTSKGVTSAEDSAAQMLQLEKLLDAKVSTVEDDQEVKHYVPTPNQKVRWFSPPSHSFHGVLQQLESIISKYELTYESALVKSDGFKDVEELNKKICKKFKKLHGCVLYSLEELGLLCAYESALCLLKKLNTDVDYGEGEDERVQSSKETFLKDALEVLAASLEAKAMEINSLDDVSEAVDKGLISPKVSLLLKCLWEYRNMESLRCIVFVERVVTAMVLARILSQVNCLSFVKCSFLSGTTAALDVMGKKQQQSTLAEFHCGKLNVLVATDVAEEGLDVQKCSSVIRFDMSKTVRSFIQSRGRARMPESDYIIFLEHDNQKQYDQLLGLQQSEESMKDQALNRTHFSVFTGKFQTDDLEVFQVETTGATVSIDSSISLISRFCANLPGDRFYRPAPEFVHEKIGDANHVCKLILPPNGPFRELIGTARRSRTLAKQSVCLEACKKLHVLGQLTDHLIPVIDVEKPEEEEVMNLSGKNVAGAGTNRRKELHGTVTTDALCGNWITGSVDASLHAYLISFEFCQKEEDPYVDLVLLLNVALDDDIANTQFPIYLSNGREAIAKVFDAGPYSISADQLEDAKAYHKLIFNGMFGKLLKQLNKKEGQSLMKNVLAFDSAKTAKYQFWDSLQMYLLLPLLPEKLALEAEELPIDWKAVRDAAVTSRLFPHLCSIQKRNTNVAVEKKFMNTYTGLQMASGVKLASELIDTAVVTVHTGRMYTVVEVLDKMNANCRMEGAEDSVYNSYSHYFAEKYKRVLEYPEQPLLRVKQSHRIHNLLTVDVAVAKKKERTEKAKKSILVELPAELCLFTGLPSALIRSLYFFPSVFHRLNALLLAAQLRSTIAKDMPQCGSIEGTMVMQALTTLRCLEGFSFEGLELLGDSFLKYAVSRYLFLVYDRKHEGQLSNRRSRLICNKTLHHLAVARHLPGYIRDEPFQPEYWKAPGMLSVKSVKCKCNLENLTLREDSCDNKDAEKGSVFRIGKTCNKGHRWMCSKTVSDAVEALIGAFVSFGDSGPALGFMKWIGMDIDFDLSLYEAARNRKVHPKVLNAVNVAGIESQLGYVFVNKALLVEALTHASKEDPHDAHDALGGGCYQRLEFLGDALLDFLITRHLFSTHPGLSPGVLSDLRSAAVNNECFARSAVKHNLQRYLRHGSGELLSQITNFVKAVEGANEAGQEEVFGWEGARGPKVLGDLVESIAGAILVDSGFDLDRVWSVMVRILSPLVTPSTLPLHPIRELHELSQSKGLSFVWKKTSTSASKEEEATATGQIEVGNEVISETAKGQLKKTARKNAAQKILSALKGMGILHPRKEAAHQNDTSPAKSCVKRAVDGDAGDSVEKKRRISYEGETSTGEAQMLDSLALQELPPVNRTSKELSSNNSSIEVQLTNSPKDEKSFTEADIAHVQHSNESVDELEISMNLKMSPTASRSEDEASACCVDSSYMANPAVHTVIKRASFSENTLKNLEVNDVFRAQRKGLSEPMDLSINVMEKGGGRSKLNVFCLKKKWPLPKYTCVEQRDLHVEKFIFTAEVDGPHGLFTGTSDAMPRKDQAKDHAAVQLLIALNQFMESS
ncbi:hypothetical protein L7F22_022992 [Adiantum nelumboides]|nr:hypothetical protein [Adiantum nelumboides]